MRASKLIVLLQAAIAEAGDLYVVLDEEDGFAAEDVYLGEDDNDETVIVVD